MCIICFFALIWVNLASSSYIVRVAIFSQAIKDDEDLEKIPVPYNILPLGPESEQHPIMQLPEVEDNTQLFLDYDVCSVVLSIYICMYVHLSSVLILLRGVFGWKSYCQGLEDCVRQ